MKPYEALATLCRNHGPMTIAELAVVLRWSVPATRRAVYRARADRLLAAIGKLPSGELVFGAMQTMQERAA